MHAHCGSKMCLDEGAVKILNTSDHLPLLVSFEIPVMRQKVEVVEGGVKWKRVAAGSDSEDLAAYRSAVSVGLAPFLGNMYDRVEDIDRDIGLVGSILKGAATDTLPHVHLGRRRRQFHDRELSDLTVRSKDVWWKWCEAGRPASGVEYEEMHMRREVRRCVHRCAGRAERRRIARREKISNDNDANRCRLLGRKKSRCSRLCADGVVVSELREAWVAHFRVLCESRVGSECIGCRSWSRLLRIWLGSHFLMRMYPLF